MSTIFDTSDCIHRHGTSHSLHQQASSAHTIEHVYIKDTRRWTQNTVCSRRPSQQTILTHSSTATTTNIDALHLAVRQRLQTKGYDRILIARSLCSFGEQRVEKAHRSDKEWKLLLGHEAACALLLARICAEDVDEIVQVSKEPLRSALEMRPDHYYWPAPWKQVIWDSYERDGAEKVVEHMMEVLPEYAECGTEGGTILEKIAAHGRIAFVLVCIVACVLMMLRVV